MLWSISFEDRTTNLAIECSPGRFHVISICRWTTMGLSSHLLYLFRFPNAWHLHCSSKVAPTFCVDMSIGQVVQKLLAMSAWVDAKKTQQRLHASLLHFITSYYTLLHITTSYYILLPYIHETS